ncbi:SDR family oxidoreductase [Erwinia sp. E_sp_B04_7]|uniref:SDR family oxidoreductase n=1 Tax=unclassified Erwinia TaxID=2622719 RepID=UPI0030CB08FB
METSKQALIIGASRGIGLGLANTLAQRGWNVSATTRNSAPVSDSGIHWLTVDINEPTQRETLKNEIEEQSFDLIFINAGMFGPDHQNLDRAKDDELSSLFLTNAISPVRCASELLPLLSQQNGTLALMTSQLASLTENPTATYPLYSASKAALNMLSRELKDRLSSGQTLLNIHPGWVQTDMGGESATLTVEQSTSGIVDQIALWSGKGGHHYIDYAGNQLSW